MTTRTFRHRATGKVVTEVKVRETVKNKPEPPIYIYQESGVTMERFPEWVINDTAAWVEQFPEGKYSHEPPVQWQAGMWGWNEESQFIFRVNKVMDDFMGNVTIDESWSYKSNSAISQRWKLLIIPGDSTPATPEQIKNYLVEEAERRGYKKGVKLAGTGIRADEVHYGEVVIDEQFPEDPTFWYNESEDFIEFHGYMIYLRGQWATIIKEDDVKFDADAIGYRKVDVSSKQNPWGRYYLETDPKAPEIKMDWHTQYQKDNSHCVESAQPDNNETYWKLTYKNPHPDYKLETGKIYPSSHVCGSPFDKLQTVKDSAALYQAHWLQVTREEYEAQERKATPINSQVEEIKKAVWAIGIHEGMYKSCKKFVEWYEENIGKKTDTTPGNNQL